MTVLFIGCVNDSGGAPRSMMSMIFNLKKYYKIEPIVITPLEKGVVNDFCKKNNITCYVVPYQDACITLGNNKLKNFLKKVLAFRTKKRYFKLNQIALEKMDDILKKHHIDLIHTNINRVTLGNLISKKYKIPQIIHIREFGKEDYCIHYYEKNIINDFKDNCVQFIAISDAVKDSWKLKGINNITTVYNGIDIINNNIDKTICYDKKVNAVFCGNILFSKGQLQLLKAIRILPENVRHKFHVDFYGNSHTKFIKFIKLYIKIFKLEKYVSFKGYKKNIEEYLSQYNMGFLCSKKEGFGRVTIEYMMHGIPVIASNTGATPEIIKHRKNGFLYEYNNIKDLRDKIVEAYYCDNINTIVAKAHLNVIENYSALRNAEEIYAIYKKI